ncbi:ABC transporter ATP-binding protein [Liquorilactobacillus sicerae]|uniref:ABC transporter ATP-binding protein n=1 Tax=Liquorilactobacillus sicerae TaxID=1416943 RepID=UPI0024802D62|nr:ABC transporter ATP-binding protein [Liquorilactobacillus sicerae]
MIKLESINKYYQQGDQRYHILKNINLKIDQGEFVSIMGQSGAGKSTLINIIGFLDDQFEGNYYYFDHPIHDYTRKQFSKLRNQNVGFVFQNFELIKNLSVAENVALPLLYAGQQRKMISQQVGQALKQVGLAGSEQKKPTNLSGGQQQRVSIARAIIARPKFLIADEPTGALDSQTSKEIMELFKNLNQQNQTTIIMVTHDERVAHQGQRIIRILDGQIIADEQIEVNA